MDINETLNEVLVKLFRDINTIEERAIRTEEYRDVTANDMHVIEAIGEVAEQTLPEGYSYEFGSSSREQSQSDNTIFILIISTILVYLLLCSLYESFFVPLAYSALNLFASRFLVAMSSPPSIRQASPRPAMPDGISRSPFMTNEPEFHAQTLRRTSL